MPLQPTLFSHVLLLPVLVGVTSVHAEQTTDYVAGAPVVLTDSDDAPNGAWCWFQSERAIVDDSDPANTLLLVGSVSHAPEGSPERGDVDLLWLNLDTGERGVAELHDRLESDDHDSPALWRRPSDGRYVAAYTRHCSDRLFRWRVSTRPGDPTAWGDEQTLDALPGVPRGDATYAHVHYAPGDRGGLGRLYAFTRSANWDPNVLASDDQGATWAYGGKLLTCGGERDRPYVRFASRDGAVHFVSGEKHPRQAHTNLSHGVVRDGALYDSFGERVDASVLDADGRDATALTRVFTSGDAPGDVTLHRAWACDLQVDADGLPVVVFTARADDRTDDHRFVYARFDGERWRAEPLAPAGGYLYDRERDYTGLASIDPVDPRTVYVSTSVDPRTHQATPHYEIYRGRRAEDAAVWAWTPITSDSTTDNLRPLVPAWDSDQTVLVWMRGAYRSWTAWETQAVATVLPREP